MKLVTRMALTPGMELAEDIFTSKNELILSADTVLNEGSIALLRRYAIMCVSIKDKADYATTHFEKLHVSKRFCHFEEEYRRNMATYKMIMNELLETGTLPPLNSFLEIHNNLRGCVQTGEELLDYLYNMLPSEDDITYAHCLNSALICSVFATWLSLSKEDTLVLILCGFFYDIGKFRFPEKVIWKPGKLNDFEYKWMQTHTTIGYNLLKDKSLNKHIINATLMHHERCDGTGYPSGLSSDEIDKFARYISIVDSYEAMTSARTYRPSLIPFQVIENFENTGVQKYDALVLKTILEHIASAQLGRTVRLSDDRIATVILINKQQLSRPLIKVGDTAIDLAVTPELSIAAVM